MDDLTYTPNMNVVRSARSFIKSLCETYGHTKGMEVWDRVREVLGDQAASDIFLGMLTHQHGIVTVKKIGNYKIEAIKLVREITNYTLVQAKNFVEEVISGRHMTLDLSDVSDEKVQNWINRMTDIGCII